MKGKYMRYLKILNKEEYGNPMCDNLCDKQATHILKDGDDCLCKECAEYENALVEKQPFASKKDGFYGVEE